MPEYAECHSYPFFMAFRITVIYPLRSIIIYYFYAGNHVASIKPWQLVFVLFFLLCEFTP